MNNLWPWLTLTLSIISGLLCFFFILLIINILTLPHLRNTHKARVQNAAATSKQEPLVSVLVPARNEASGIERCIRSLAEQDYPHLEVLVLDDQSTDGTAEIIESVITELPATLHNRLRLLRGTELPQGWVGKNYACYQLAQQAQGKYLLFTDADTEHKSEMVSATVTWMEQTHVALLTAIPEYIMDTTGERLIIPLLNFLLLTLLPIILVHKTLRPSFSMGNGQFLCFTRQGYQTIGGHEAVRTQILEDVTLARNIKKAGLPMLIVDGVGLITCRMYTSLGEVWQGFSKNLYALYGYSLPAAISGLLMNLLLYILPPLLALATLFSPIPPTIGLLALSIYGVAVLMRMLLVLNYTSKQRGKMLLISLFHPISMCLESLILLNAIRWRYRKTGTQWKDRQYSM